MQTEPRNQPFCQQSRIVSGNGRTAGIDRPTGKIAVIGYGGLFQGEGPAGWRACDVLAGLLGGRGAQLITQPYLTPDIADRLSDADLVVFLNARWMEPSSQIAGHQPAAEHGERIGPHHTTPAELLAAVEILYGRRPQAISLTLSAECSGQPVDDASPTWSCASGDILTRATSASH
jgi:hypothetical protein